MGFQKCIEMEQKNPGLTLTQTFNGYMNWHFCVSIDKQPHSKTLFAGIFSLIILRKTFEKGVVIFPIR